MRNFLAFSTQLENGIQLLQNEDSLAVERLQFRRFIQHSFLDFSPIENARYRFRLSAILHIFKWNFNYCPNVWQRFSTFSELLPNADLRLLFLLGAPIAKTAQGVEFIDSGQMHTKLVENQEMLLSVLGRLPELVSELVHTQDLELIELRWTDLRVFHLIENLTSLCLIMLCISIFRLYFLI
jgi:hypothetical protein